MARWVKGLAAKAWFDPQNRKRQKQSCSLTTTGMLGCMHTKTSCILHNTINFEEENPRNKMSFIFKLVIAILRTLL